MKSEYEFFKDDESRSIWRVETGENTVGVFLFSFDRKKVYNLFRDYPYKLSQREKMIFDKEYPFGADFFKDRK